MIFESGKFYKLRNGKKAQVLITDKKGGKPLGGVIFNDSRGLDIMTSWREDGSDGNHADYDIISEWQQIEITSYLGVYPGGFGLPQKALEGSMLLKCVDRIGTIAIKVVAEGDEIIEVSARKVEEHEG